MIAWEELTFGKLLGEGSGERAVPYHAQHALVPRT